MYMMATSSPPRSSWSPTCTATVRPPIHRPSASVRPPARNASRALARSPCRSPIATSRSAAGRNTGPGRPGERNLCRLASRVAVSAASSSSAAPPLARGVLAEKMPVRRGGGGCTAAPWACRVSTKASTKGDHTGASVRHRGSVSRGLLLPTPIATGASDDTPRDPRARATSNENVLARSSESKFDRIGRTTTPSSAWFWSSALVSATTHARRGSDVRGSQFPPRRSGASRDSVRAPPSLARLAGDPRPDPGFARIVVMSALRDLVGAPGSSCAAPRRARPRRPLGRSPTRSSAIVRESTRSTSAGTRARAPTRRARERFLSEQRLARKPARRGRRRLQRPPGRTRGTGTGPRPGRRRRRRVPPLPGAARARGAPRRPRRPAPAAGSDRDPTRRHPALSAAASFRGRLREPTRVRTFNPPPRISPSAPRRRR